jgi:hypothetical protein
LIEITDGVGVPELEVDTTDELDNIESVLLVSIVELDVLDGFERVLLDRGEVLDVVCTLELNVEDAEAVVELMVVQGRTLTAWL